MSGRLDQVLKSRMAEALNDLDVLPFDVVWRIFQLAGLDTERQFVHVSRQYRETIVAYADPEGPDSVDAQRAIGFVNPRLLRRAAVVKVDLQSCTRYGEWLEFSGQVDAAMEWYERAAQGGESQAEFRIGLLLEMGYSRHPTDPETSLRSYITAAGHGHPRALWSLGKYYHVGKGGLRRIPSKAIEYYTKAHNAGDSRGSCALGFCHEFGIGFRENPRRAVELYRKSAETGDPEGQFNLAVCYETGTGLEKNRGEAMLWYKRAASQGRQEAQFMLGFAHERGFDGIPDAPQAIHWYNLSIRGLSGSRTPPSDLPSARKAAMESATQRLVVQWTEDRPRVIS